MAARAIGEALRVRSAIDGARPAIFAPEEGVELAFGQLVSLSQRLLELTGGTGATVAVCASSRFAQAALLSAGLMAGCVICPINPTAPPDVRTLRRRNG